MSRAQQLMRSLTLATLIALLWHGSGNAASFDCEKARTVHEKHICGSPDLSAADARLGEAYRAAVRSFPVKAFVQATERRFLLRYQSCDSQYGLPCAALLAKRTATLGLMVNPDAVYTDVTPAESFDPEKGVFWIATSETDPTLHYFGSFMPDGNTPAPFPNGFVCDDEVPLRKTTSGYKALNDYDDVSITDGKITASISCSPRNAMSGEYARVR